MFNYSNTKVTVELRELVENGVKLWDFEYPSYYKGDEKTAFEQKVIDHFYFRQIGQETTGRFLHYFRSKVREIMPYYIDLYRSVDLFKSIDDPLQSYDLTETFTKDGKSETQSQQSENTNHTHIFSDTPQGNIDNLNTHMSDASKDTNTNSANGSGTVETEENYTLRRFGNIGVQPLGDEIKKLRDAYINIDMMIINELNDLFLKVY